MTHTRLPRVLTVLIGAAMMLGLSVGARTAEDGRIVTGARPGGPPEVKAGGVFVADAPAPTAPVAALLERPQNLLDASALTPADGRSLQATLTVALALLARGNRQGALDALEAFANQVRPFIATGTQPASDAQPLIDTVETLRGALGA